MASPTAPNNIVLYNYEFSPFGKRITTYLALRGIDYAVCQQPPTMPRPDLALLPIAYRRIPILALGRNIYLDTRLILRKLETLFPSCPKLGATNPQDLFVQQLLQKYMIEGPVFGIAAGLVPLEVVRDPVFSADRQGMFGKTWSEEELREGRGECLSYVRGMFEWFEEGVLGDGRMWVVGGEGVGMTDIEAIWPFDFLTDMHLPPDLISPKQYPKVYAWLARYRAAREQASNLVPKPTVLDGQAAANCILGSELAETSNSVDEQDPLGLKQGVEVEVYPADWGSEYRDRGRLVGLSVDEVVIAVESKGEGKIWVHAPRTGFKIKEVGRK
ncbi:hypothetical protein EJ02DRAFT_500660 [Clathrospora elynae]|uniref:Uncharacterized protein n=1 Tax=Clathrospora elynae TaxID=706981 RepID=A0A6A5SZJ5_9PLEO|nr:hypothetical protein EJ02DRAFT_500660 [Clathrospora elynae]